MKIRNRNIIHKLYFIFLDIYIFLANKFLKIKISLVYDDINNIQIPKITKLKFSSRIGLIVQGPIVKNITFKNLEYYRKLYPKLNIVLSSTDNVSQNDIYFLKKLKIFFVKSTKVDTNFSNIINQSNTCLNAAKFLKNLKIQYILKTRSDQKLTNPEFLPNIINHYKAFSDNKSKILFTSFGAHRYWPFDMSDFIIFAKTNVFISLVKLSNAEKEILQSEKFIIKKILEIRNAKTNLDWSKVIGGGAFFMKSYLNRKYKIKIKHDLNTYYRFLKSDFIVIDNYYIGIQWYKYNNLLHRDSENYYFSEKDYELTFLFWYCLYQNVFVEKNIKNVLEKVSYG